MNTGEERDWGEVLAYEPGTRVAFSFQLGRPRDKSGEVEVRDQFGGQFLRTPNAVP